MLNYARGARVQANQHPTAWTFLSKLSKRFFFFQNFSLILDCQTSTRTSYGNFLGFITSSNSENSSLWARKKRRQSSAKTKLLLMEMTERNSVTFNDQSGMQILLGCVGSDLLMYLLNKHNLRWLNSGRDFCPRRSCLNRLCSAEKEP